MEDAMIIAIILSLAGLGFLCWLAFNLAVNALPFFAAVAAGLFAYHAGAGPIGAITICLITGAATLVIGQFLFAAVHSTILRTMIAAAFALPAAIAAYQLVLGLGALGIPSDTWRHVLAMIGAAVVGSTAWVRLVAHRWRSQTGVLARPACRRAEAARTINGTGSSRHRDTAG
jgi:hypothetical protein